MRVASKGLLVICAPLLFQVAFAGSLFGLLNQFHAELEKGDAAREAVVTAYKLQSHLIDASTAAGTFAISQDQRLKSWFELEIEEIGNQSSKLKKLTQDDPEQLENVQVVDSSIQEILRIYEKLMDAKASLALVSGGAFVTLQKPMNRGGTAAGRLIERAKIRAEEEVRNRGKTTGIINTFLVGGLVVDVLVTVFLSLFFTRSVSNRLGIVSDNVARLAARTQLNPLMPAEDEISEVDAAVHDAAAALTKAEQQKTETLLIMREQLLKPLKLADEAIARMNEPAGHLNEKAAKRLEFARSSMQRVLRMVHDLMDTHGGDKFHLSIKPVDSAELINNAVALTKAWADVREVSIECTSDPVTFEGDFDLLNQVIVNFITNAIKHSPDGSVIRIVGAAREAGLRIEVIDSGQGVPKESQEKIFEPFQQVEEADATKRGGAGLGLAICKSIVEEHHGRIGVDSEVGKGSNFFLELPLIQDNLAKPAESNKSRGVSRSISAKGLFIVSLPVVITVILVAFLATTLAQMDRAIQSQTHAKQVAVTVTEIVNEMVNTGRATITQAVRPGKASNKSVRKYRRLMQRHLLHLQEQLKGSGKEEDLARKVAEGVAALDPSNLVTKDNIPGGKNQVNIAAAPGFTVKIAKVKLVAGELLAIESNREKAGKAAAAKAFNRISMSLPVALGLSLLLSLLSIVYFTRDISSRLAILRAKAAKFSSSEGELGEPAEGNDEIAGLDAFFHETYGKMRALEEFRKHLVGVVSHELKTPLATIFGTLTSLKLGVFGDVSAELKILAQSTERQMQKIIQMVHDLLDIEKIHSGTFVLNVQETDLFSVCRQAVELAIDTDDEDGPIVAVSAGEQKVALDQERIARLLSTLIENLLTIKQDDDLKLSAIVEGAEAKFSVRSDLTEPLATVRLFERFSNTLQGSASNSKFMNIGRGIISEHKGRLGVDTNQNESIFWIRLPADGSRCD